jgi:hypothetical protein
MNQSNTNEAQPQTVAQPTEISFAEYVDLRKSGKPLPVSDTAAPAKTAVQETASESAIDETEEVRADAKDESEESDELDVSDKPKKKSGYIRKIDKLTARVNAERERAERAEMLLAQKAAGDKAPEPKVEAKIPDGEPQADQFETYQEYVNALTDWKVEQKFKAREEAEKKTALEREQEKLFTSHQERVKSFAEKTKDFQDVMESVDHIPVSVTLQDIILNSDNGPELMYTLAKDPENFERIAKLGPIAAAREIGRIESKINHDAKTSEEPKITKQVTNAPKPIAPIGSGTGTVKKSPDEMTLAEYTAWRSKKR